MRIRNVVAAGSAVGTLSMATTMMASVTASAAVSATAAVQAPVVHVSTASAGSAAGLMLGMLLVAGFAGISFVVRVGSGRRTPARVISVPEARVSRTFAPAFAE